MKPDLGYTQAHPASALMGSCGGEAVAPCMAGCWPCPGRASAEGESLVGPPP